jgi:type IV pilus assembly protein PilA
MPITEASLYRMRRFHLEVRAPKRNSLCARHENKSAGAVMNRKRRRRGFSLIELMIVIAIMLTISAIAVHNYHKAVMHANETAAYKTIQTIHTAQVQYQTQYGRFAPSLRELGPPQNGESNQQAADLIDCNLAAGEVTGYRFNMTGNSAGYAVSAVPVTYDATGSLTFYSDQTMRIRQHKGPEPATAQSPMVHH